MLKENNSTIAEIVSARVFNDRREIVFQAWANPHLLAQWWGPKGFTNTFHAFDFKTGGLWNFTMHGPDGVSYHNKNRFAAITIPEKIIFEHLEPIHTFKATASFEEADDKTKLVFSMLFASVDEFEKVKDFIAVTNEENFDRLETVLKTIK